MKTLLALLGGIGFGWSIAYNAVLFNDVWLFLAPIVAAAGMMLYGLGRILPHLGGHWEMRGASLVVWLLLSLGTLYTLPNAFGRLPLPTQERHATIKSKDDSARLGSRVAFVEHDCLLCGVRIDRSQWQALEVGATVRLTIIGSPFGAIVKAVSVEEGI